MPRPDYYCTWCLNLDVVPSKSGMGLAWRQVTGDTELVSIWVSKVGAIVMLVVFRPKAGPTFRRAAIGQGYGVCIVYNGATLCEESNHLAVTRRRRLLIGWLSDEEQWPRIG